MSEYTGSLVMGPHSRGYNVYPNSSWTIWCTYYLGTVCNQTIRAVQFRVRTKVGPKH